MSMERIAPVCSISWVNKDLNSLRKVESCTARSTGWVPEATTWENGAGGCIGI